MSCCLSGQNLAGLSNEASQAFLPLSGDQQHLQPGGIEDLMTYYTQNEENAARRELQQGTTYVDNLLPSAWDNIGNEVPALDVGLPDWNAHVRVFHLSTQQIPRSCAGDVVPALALVGCAACISEIISSSMTTTCVCGHYYAWDIKTF